MTIQEFKTHIEEELRHKLKCDNEPTPILDRLELHLKDFDNYDLTDLLNPKNMKHDLYVSFLFQICFPSRIKMDIDAEYTPIKKKRIAIVSCKSKKQDYTCSADEMYSPSSIYRAQKEFFIKGYDDYYIVSAEYGIIPPSQIIKPYNRAIGVSSKEMNLNTIQGYKEGILNLIEKQIQWMLKQEWDVDFHTSMNYYNPLSNNIKEQLNYIKQPMGAGASGPKYREALDKLDNESLDKCLEFISYRDSSKKTESSKWFYHNEYPPFFGTTGKLIKEYKDLKLNAGGLYKVTNNMSPHFRGWVIDQSLLTKLHKNDKGQWRLKK